MCAKKIRIRRRIDAQSHNPLRDLWYVSSAILWSSPRQPKTDSPPENDQTNPICCKRMRSIIVQRNLISFSPFPFDVEGGSEAKLFQERCWEQEIIPENAAIPATSKTPLPAGSLLENDQTNPIRRNSMPALIVQRIHNSCSPLPVGEGSGVRVLLERRQGRVASRILLTPASL